MFHSKCQVALPPLCREIEMPYFFKNTSEKPKLVLQKKKEIHDTNLASFPSDISRNSAFHPNIPSLPATLCCPLSSTSPSELHTDVWGWKSCPLEIMPCIANSEVPPSKYCAWHGDEATAHLLHELLSSLCLLAFEFPLYWKHLSVKPDVKKIQTLSPTGSSWRRRHNW